ncbi:MAG: preprotein translocase subunit SecG [Firmicutes bacterium]|nr:preprotein translocase subunit SecG [Bacillota bacterium]
MLENILLIISVLLIAIVLLQGNKATDSSGLITGGNQELFQNMKERGVELFISRATFILGVLFFVISLVIFLI